MLIRTVACWAMPSYDGHPLDLTCPQCRMNGTAWFSADEAFHLRVDQIPTGFRLMDQPAETVGPQFSCLQCDIAAMGL